MNGVTGSPSRDSNRVFFEKKMKTTWHQNATNLMKSWTREQNLGTTGRRNSRLTNNHNMIHQEPKKIQKFC